VLAARSEYSQCKDCVDFSLCFFLNTPGTVQISTRAVQHRPTDTADLSSLVLDATSAAYAVCNPATGEVLWANQRFRERFHTEFAVEELLVGNRPPSGWRLETRPLVAPDDLMLLELIPLADSGTVCGPASEIDAVTSVLSRGALMATIEQRFAARSRRPFALVFLDLVDFKHVNDHHGHLVGDKCLAEVGARLHHLVRAADAVGRFGGDEFLVVLDGVSDPTTYAPIRQRLIEGFVAPVTIGALALPLGASLGVAYSTDGYETVDAMIHAADSAMYAQKRGACLSGD
jgi:diguanylate cyclase (GGDEF)-like protein